MIPKTLIDTQARLASAKEDSLQPGQQTLLAGLDVVLGNPKLRPLFESELEELLRRRKILPTIEPEPDRCSACGRPF